MFENMILTAVCAVGTLAILAFIFWQLARTNTDIRPQDDYLSPKDALRFRLDNDLPIK